MKRQVLWILTCMLRVFSLAQTSFSPGDIAIVHYNSDNPDALSFVCLRTVDSGSSLYFTDNGWLSVDSFRNGEGVFYWEADKSYSCGAVVSLDSIAPMSLSTAGDQVLVYQGSFASPQFITAFNNEGSAVWQSTATSSNSSALPSGLQNGYSAVAIMEVDNARYTDTVQGSLSAIRSLLFDSSRLSGSNTTRQTWNGHFNLSGCSLPLQWLYQSVELENGQLVLRWTTTDELNCSHFKIEVAESGMLFKPIETVMAQNEWGINQYRLLLPNTAKGLLRIKQLDFDGKWSYSPSIFMPKTVESPFSIAFSKEALTIACRGPFHCRIIDFCGVQLVEKSTVEKLIIDLQDLNRMVFILELKSGGYFEKHKLLLTH